MSPKPVDQYVSVPESGGTVKKIRNAEYAMVKADGSEHTVESQVTMTLRPDGSLADTDTSELAALLRGIAERLEYITLLLENVLSGAGNTGSSVPEIGASISAAAPNLR